MDAIAETVLAYTMDFVSKRSSLTSSARFATSVADLLRRYGTPDCAGTTILPGAVLKGDLSAIRIGRYCAIGERTVIRPPALNPDSPANAERIPVAIGSYVVIEADCVVEAAYIGSFVHVGQGCTIGARCILKDCCQLLPGTCLAPGTVVPPFAVFGGNPGLLVGELSEAMEDIMRASSMGLYRRFTRK
eukprot:jgi/Mesvir1/16874/Mv15758-RA.1